MDVTDQPLGLLKVQTVAKRLELAEKTIWKMIYNGTLPSVKVGSARRVTTRALNEYILSLSEQQEAG